MLKYLICKLFKCLEEVLSLCGNYSKHMDVNWAELGLVYSQTWKTYQNDNVSLQKHVLNMFPLVDYEQNTDYNLVQLLISLVMFAVHLWPSDTFKKIVFSNCSIYSMCSLENMQLGKCFQKEWNNLNTTEFHHNFILILTANLKEIFYISQ